MPLTVTLTPELEQRLAQEAQRKGVSVEACALKVLDQHLPPKDRQAKLIVLLQEWIDEKDIEEQQETGNYLVRSLDQDRLSERKLFPLELKGITW